MVSFLLSDYLRKPNFEYTSIRYDKQLQYEFSLYVRLLIRYIEG